MSSIEKTFEVMAEPIRFDPALRKSWKDGGDWPHAKLYHYYEAIAAAHFIMRGYHVLRDYVSTRTTASRAVVEDYSRIFHRVVGAEARAYLLQSVDNIAPAGLGQPDLFVFREEATNDPNCRYADPRLWFFVEVKGPGDVVGDNQKRFWRAIASRPDLGLGPERIRLARVLANDAAFRPEAVTY